MPRFFILLLLAIAVYGQEKEQKLLAILRTVDDGDPPVEITELNFLTLRLREIAGNVLQNNYGIMTEQSIIDKLGKENAVKACKETEGCLAQLGKRINADYIGQARLGRFGGNLTISVELYNSGNGLQASPTITGQAENVSGLLAILDEKAPGMFGKMPDALGGSKAHIVPAHTASVTFAISSFRDSRDNKTYKVVKIGTQTWMAENLNYETDKSWCYDNAKFNCDKYGRLYDWNTAKNVCPSGWKLPSRSEWTDLILTVGKKDAWKKLRSRDWQGTDDFGFSALLGGRRNTGGSYSYLGENGRWWTSDLNDEGSNAYYQFINYADYIDENSRPNDLTQGYSVRCVMGSPESNIAKPAIANSNITNKKSDNIFIDLRDNQEYKFVEIGRLVWMTKNMNYEIGTSYCYEKDAFNCKKYGRLYDWKTAKEVCPNGWHLPTRREWHDLIRSVDEKTTTVFSDISKELFGNLMGGKETSAIDNAVSGKRLKSTEYKGTDNYGFSALLGGGRNDTGFFYIDKGAAWWTATEANNDKKAYDMYIYLNEDIVKEGIFGKSDGYSVRCVKDYK